VPESEGLGKYKTRDQGEETSPHHECITWPTEKEKEGKLRKAKLSGGVLATCSNRTTSHPQEAVRREGEHAKTITTTVLKEEETQRVEALAILSRND